MNLGAFHGRNTTQRLCRPVVLAGEGGKAVMRGMALPAAANPSAHPVGRNDNPPSNPLVSAPFSR